MAIDDRQRARSMAFQLAADLAKAHAARLDRLFTERDVESALAEPIEKARARYRKKVAPALHGIFAEAVEEKLVRPVAKRIARERAAEDREAVREDLGYRTAEERPRPKPEPEPEPEKKRKRRRREREQVVPGLADYRRTGTIFVWIGALLTVGMAAIAVIAVRKDRLAQRVQTTFVHDTCTIVESRNVRGEGGSFDHVVAFEHQKDGRNYRSDRYSPDVQFGPGAGWMPVGKVVDCYCAPDDPAECFLYKGQEKNREQIPWIYILLFPALWLGMGFAMRNAKKLPDD